MIKCKICGLEKPVMAWVVRRPMPFSDSFVCLDCLKLGMMFIEELQCFLEAFPLRILEPVKEGPEKPQGERSSIEDYYSAVNILVPQDDFAGDHWRRLLEIVYAKTVRRRPVFDRINFPRHPNEQTGAPGPMSPEGTKIRNGFIIKWHDEIDIINDLVSCNCLYIQSSQGTEKTIGYWWTDPGWWERITLLDKGAEIASFLREYLGTGRNIELFNPIEYQKEIRDEQEKRKA